MICTIYVIRNKTNSKVYIGQTWDLPHKRFRAHLLERTGECPKLFNALNKYGRKTFYFETLVFCEDQVMADKLECFFIRFFNSLRNGYNTKEGGRGGRHSASSKLKMSKAHRGKPKTEEHKAKIGIGNKGKSRSIEIRKKLSDINRGKILTKEHRDKISKTLIGNQRRKGIPNSNEARKKISLRLIGNRNRLGCPHTTETKQLLSRLNSGENNRNAKLTAELVNQIKTDYQTVKSQRKLAAKYCVCKTTIARILNGEAWCLTSRQAKD